MEEVDAIIIHSLRAIGCDLGSEVECLKQFTTESIYGAVLKCVEVTRRSEAMLPHTLPQGMSQRFRVGTSLAALVTELGYSGEIGYQTFLYSNENDIRKVFMFLVEKLPRETSESSEESVGKAALLQRTIGAEIARRLRCTWTPPCCKDRGLAWRGRPVATWSREGAAGLRPFDSCRLCVPAGLNDLAKKIPKEVRNYYDKHLLLACEQPKLSRDFLASVLETNDLAVLLQQEMENEWNQLGLTTRLSQQDYKTKSRSRIRKMIADQVNSDLKRLAELRGEESQDLTSLVASISHSAGTSSSASSKMKGSRFTHSEKLQFTEDKDAATGSTGGSLSQASLLSTDEEAKKAREEEATVLAAELKGTTLAADAAELELRRLNINTKEANEQVSRIEKDLSEKEQANAVKKKTIDLLPDAQSNISKLQFLVDGSCQKLANLGDQWKQREEPLLQEIERLKSLDTGKEMEIREKLEEMKQFRERMKEVVSDTKGKEDLLKQLSVEYERMAKDVNRSVYTKRIMEIVGNIKKQKQDIDKVLTDTKGLQKEINQLSGVLERTFTVTDELVFKDAKKDEDVRKVYKQLAALHENCLLLVATIEETGTIAREIRELEDQVEQEGNKKLVDNLAKINEDLQQLKTENSGLISRLKAV